MKYFLDLFSGIGGFALGAEWAGLHFDAHYYSEVDPYAIKVYEKRFPTAIALGDIRSIRGADLPEGDWIIAGGFPCQDISVAGKGAGLEGERSGLWYEYARLIGELRPRYAIMENVGALAFRGLDRVLGSLAALGYDAEWQDIRASDVGAPHRRERIWIVAYSQDSGAARGKRIAGHGSVNGGGGHYRGIGGHGNAGDKDVADSEGQGIGGLSIQSRESRRSGADTEWSGQVMADPMCQGLSNWNTGENRQGAYPESSRKNSGYAGSQWATEPDVGRVAHGVPSRVDRLKCLGNSIVPQIAGMIFAQSAFDEWRRQ